VTHTLIRGVFRRAYAAATGRTESVVRGRVILDVRGHEVLRALAGGFV